MLDKVRIDKWLWSVRIFKSRTIAGASVRDGKVRVNDKIVKASSNVGRGDTIVVKKNGINYTFKVLDLVSTRVGAPIAVKCYSDLTPEAELRKFDDWFVGKTGAEYREKGLGRPTKRDRRDIDGFKTFYFDDEDGEEDED